jgi:hypothetical protein
MGKTDLRSYTFTLPSPAIQKAMLTADDGNMVKTGLAAIKEIIK